MTCFWDGILNTLTNEDFEKFKFKKMPNSEFVLFLKKFNKKTENVNWNNEKFSDRQLDENFTHIKDFDYQSIRNGYDCSTCDPFLILICELFCVSIVHNYIGNKLYYNHSNPKRVLNFGSNSGHFYNS
tara:strand:- start:2741 stop:3124 length:384 start_codon:yes stop_codon:yes gene_type:complete